MKSLVLLLIFPGIFLAVEVPADYEFLIESSSMPEHPSTTSLNETAEEMPGEIQDVQLAKYQKTSNLRVYNGPLPRFPGTTSSPWVALHSPIKMYIPIRNTGDNSPESEDCVRCPRNLIIQLPPGQKHIMMPVPTISLCSSFAQQSGRVHVAVVSGPRPGQPLDIGRHEIQLMIWKAEGLVHSCNYTILVRGKRRGSTPTRFYVQQVPCPKPPQPTNGILLCVPNNIKYYQHNSVCQFFCLDNHLIETTKSNSTTIICKNGKWSPDEHVSCIATFCPKLPDPPSFGSWNCDADDANKNFINGTLCKLSCAPGFVIETSQIKNATIVCVPDTWKVPQKFPECKRAHLPRLKHCQNRHVILNPGQVIVMSKNYMPKGSSYSGAVLSPECNLQGKNISRGKYQVSCEVKDPELRTSQKCLYNIHIEESSTPQAHASDCKNKTVFANRKGTLYPKPVRFSIKIGKPSRTQIIRSNCTPRGELSVGSHFISCKGTNPHTGSIGTCSYWLNVEERSCPPLEPIPNGRILCASRSLESVCHYECDVGFKFPDSQVARAKKTCQSNFKWQPASNPSCEMEPPKLKEGCEDLEISLSPPVLFTVPLPSFLTALNETLNVSCTPSVLRTVGYHEVECVTDDDIFNTSCHFNISILLNAKISSVSPSKDEGESPTLLEGCNDLELNLSFPVNFSVPLPHYVTSQNKTLDASCEPSYIATTGQHQVKCMVEDSPFYEYCAFNVSLESEEETIPTTNQEMVEPPMLVEGCNDLQVNTTSPVNYTIPLPQYQTSQNETLLAVCEPSSITAVGKYLIKCALDSEYFNESCHFNVTILFEEVTAFPPQTEDKTLKKVKGCKKMEVNVSPPFNFTIPSPRYLTSQNETLYASCEPSYVTTIGNFQVNCSIDNFTLPEDCIFNVTVSLDESVTTQFSEKGTCLALSSPEHGSVSCFTRGQVETCQVTCDPGYGFSDDYMITAICDGSTDGLWDFQRNDINGTLPKCFAQVEGSAVEIWISFEAFSPNCEEELEEQVNSIIEDLCQLDTNCSKVIINCTLDEESDTMLVTINFTAQADFDTDEYIEHEEIPEAETRLESVLERTRTLLATETTVESLNLFRDSFRRGHMTLVCPSGFAPDSMMANCVQCSIENSHCKSNTQNE